MASLVRPPSRQLSARRWARWYRVSSTTSVRLQYQGWQRSRSLTCFGDYLTSEGQPGTDDRQMIIDAGFTIEGVDEQTLPAARHDLVAIRRRGAGTALPSNT
jgi:hypothetical protein